MSRPRLDADVCVVGAGVMGASAAWHLARRGVDVLVLDKSLGGSEASGATAGTLAIQNKRPAAIPFVLRALDMWRSLSEQLRCDVEYEVRGGLRIAHTADDVEKLERAVVHADLMAGAEFPGDADFKRHGPSVRGESTPLKWGALSSGAFGRGLVSRGASRRIGA